MVQDISRRTVIILVIAAFLVSFAGTIAVLKNIEMIGQSRKSFDDGMTLPASGSISLTVLEPPVTSGNIQIEILPRNQELKEQ